ncbi:DUF4183 domain-containing protein [Paenibacillus protaetiae]|uniref:DUF4183 domain-containing protein n=1 Tax=Paenibacillus protaetiae TaxID=2509456 RepID=UPI0013ED4ED2|nr:DUF4183 domain-containing protein [Paenibacillus protaetiae]
MKCAPMKRKKGCNAKVVIVCPPKRKKRAKKKARPRQKRKRKLHVTIIPSIQRYFTLAEADIALTTGKTLYASQFVNDAGEAISRFAEHGRSGYYNLYINSTLQSSQLYTIDANTLVIFPTGQIIKENTPIILESVAFAAEINRS